MSHEGQKRLNKIATGLRGNELWLYGYYKTSIKAMRKFVKKKSYIILIKWWTKPKKEELEINE